MRLIASTALRTTSPLFSASVLAEEDRILSGVGARSADVFIRRSAEDSSGRNSLGQNCERRDGGAVLARLRATLGRMGKERRLGTARLSAHAALF